MSFIREIMRPWGSLVLSLLVVGLTVCIFVAQVFYTLIKDGGYRRGLLERVFGKRKRWG